MHLKSNLHQTSSQTCKPVVQQKTTFNSMFLLASNHQSSVWNFILWSNVASYHRIRETIYHFI